MKTLETQLFSFSELSDDAKAKVLESHSQSVYSDPEDFTLSECVNSLKAICEAMNTPLLDWSVGPHSRSNFAKVDPPSFGYWGERLDGGGFKTVYLFVSMLVRTGYPRPARFADMKLDGLCKFTGVCFDDDLAEFILAELINGKEWSAAIDSCADHIAGIAEKDLEYRASEESFLEYEDGEEIYTSKGEINR